MEMKLSRGPWMRRHLASRHPILSRTNHFLLRTSPAPFHQFSTTSVSPFFPNGPSLLPLQGSKVLIKGMRYHELEKWVQSYGYRPAQALMLWKRLYGNNIWGHCSEELEGQSSVLWG
ncbi:hypothetical protein ACS0TY_024313 [Phlomoides rotata]